MRVIRDTTVAVVGGAGFLGSHLVNHLIDDRNCDVVVIDNLVSGRREFIHPGAVFVHHDITASEERMKNVFVASGAKFVFNYAAEPYIPVSFERPLHVFDVNAMGAVKVINAAQEAGCLGILQVSSAEIYGGGSPTDDTLSSVSSAIDEEYHVSPHSSYGAAKAAIDAMVQVRWKEAMTPCIALRQFNCVGERETHPYVIPEIISQVHRQERTGMYVKMLLGNNSFRDFQYALDAVRDAVLLLEKGQFGEVYNMGSESGIRIYDLAHMIAKLMKSGDLMITKDPDRVRPWEIWHLLSDNSKLESVIGARRNTSLEDALILTIKDFRANGCKWCWE